MSRHLLCVTSSHHTYLTTHLLLASRCCTASDVVVRWWLTPTTRAQLRASTHSGLLHVLRSGYPLVSGVDTGQYLRTLPRVWIPDLSLETCHVSRSYGVLLRYLSVLVHSSWYT